MCDFKKGQRVWCFVNGWGKVSDTDRDSAYTVGVEFDAGGFDTFTEDGKMSEGAQRTLFFREIPIPKEALIPPVKEIILNTGDIVLFNSGELGYVETYSGDNNKLFFFHRKVPKNLDEAFGPTSESKTAIKKVIGNINA